MVRIPPSRTGKLSCKIVGDVGSSKLSDDRSGRHGASSGAPADEPQKVPSMFDRKGSKT